jgi:hypothetical protein
VTKLLDSRRIGTFGLATCALYGALFEKPTAPYLNVQNFDYQSAQWKNAVLSMKAANNSKDLGQSVGFAIIKNSSRP